MNKELERYMLKKMLLEKYGSETFKEAIKLYKDIIDYGEMGFWKMFMVNFGIGSYNSKHYERVKELQDKLIEKRMVEFAKSGKAENGKRKDN